MPENVTPERTQLLQMYGAEIVYSRGRPRAPTARSRWRSTWPSTTPRTTCPTSTATRPTRSRTTTAPRSRSSRSSTRSSAFVAGLGTGGTLMGNGRRLKEELGDDVKIVAAEPMQGEPVQGLRSLDDGFIPPIIDLSLLDRKIFVTNRDAIVLTRKLLDEEGVFAGVSSGAIASSRGAHRRRARRGQRRLHRRRRRLEVPVLRASTPVRSTRSRIWTPPSGGDRRRWRRAAYAAGAAGLDRRRRCGCCASCRRGAAAARLAPARRPQDPAVGAGTDVSILNQLLDLCAADDRRLHGRRCRSSSGHLHAALKQFLDQELEHAGELYRLIKRRAATPNKPSRATTSAGPAAARTSSRFSMGSSRSMVAEYLASIPQLSPGIGARGHRLDPRHRCPARRRSAAALRLDPLPSAFVTGNEPSSTTMPTREHHPGGLLAAAAAARDCRRRTAFGASRPPQSDPMLRDAGRDRAAADRRLPSRDRDRRSRRGCIVRSAGCSLRRTPTPRAVTRELQALGGSRPARCARPTRSTGRWRDPRSPGPRLASCATSTTACTCCSTRAAAEGAYFKAISAVQSIRRSADSR